MAQPTQATVSSPVDTQCQAAAPQHIQSSTSQTPAWGLAKVQPASLGGPRLAFPTSSQMMLINEAMESPPGNSSGRAVGWRLGDENSGEDSRANDPHQQEVLAQVWGGVNGPSPARGGSLAGLGGAGPGLEKAGLVLRPLGGSASLEHGCNE